MANETIVTIQGWVASVPMAREVNGTPVLNFRVGCTPRHLNRATGQWVDGETQWYGVSAWRRLAEHGGQSLRQGDAVVVHGRLSHRTYVNKSNVEALGLEIDAFTIGHDLSRGTATFTKATAPAAESGSTADPGHGGSPVAA
ncbi:MAG: single-stranded DNA-binding protein [Actinomycetales bacterium]|nr:MAG: single-stranded DNA-binding protein [Actinomycetales bacterium]